MDDQQELMNRRRIFYDWWKINRKHQSSDMIYKSYHEKDAEVKKLIRKSKQDNFSNKFKSVKTSKEKWNLIHEFGITKKARKEVSIDVSEIINLDTLNEEFTKLKPIPKKQLDLEIKTTSFRFREVTEEVVYNTIFEINSNSTGPDNIPPKCFKALAQYISAPIANIINCSFNTGIFPSILKNISITPIQKIEVPTNASHFRPISNANFLCKIISTITCKQFSQYLEHNKIISRHQSGFCNKHSCTTAILQLTEDMHKYIANGKCVILVLLDFANAFGSVDHDRLIQILISVGVDVNSIKWFGNVLKGWNQTIKNKNKLSKPRTITRGIIQGENNSQLLLSLFINNIVKYIQKCKVILFADDVQIYIKCEVKKINDTIKIINEDLKNIIRFGNDYGIDINPNKTKAITVSSKQNLNKLKYEDLPNVYINDVKIEFVDEVRNLGYFLNRTLTNESHIRILQQKVFGAINTINPLKNVITREVKLQLVKTLILPIIDYMDVVYHDYGVHGTNRNSLI